MGGGGHKIFDHQIGGVIKILPSYFQKFMTPHSKENGGPLKSGLDWATPFKIHTPPVEDFEKV